MTADGSIEQGCWVEKLKSPFVDNDSTGSLKCSAGCSKSDTGCVQFDRIDGYSLSGKIGCVERNDVGRPDRANENIEVSVRESGRDRPVDAVGPFSGYGVRPIHVGRSVDALQRYPTCDQQGGKSNTG